MLNARVAGTLVLVFLAGVATGMVGMRYGLHDQIHRGPQTGSTVLEHFRKELELSPEQTTRLAAVLDDYQHYYQSLEDQIEDLRLREQIEDLRSTGKSRILEILNPEQREKFEKMSKEMAPGVVP
jgi:Spy/CpxP family protein refolding chaperone